MIDIYEYYKVFELSELSPLEYSQRIYGNKKSFSVNISKPPKFFFFSLKHAQRVYKFFPLEIESVIGPKRAKLICKGIDFDSSPFRTVIKTVKGGGPFVSGALGMKKSNLFVQLKRFDNGYVSDILLLRFIRTFHLDVEREFEKIDKLETFFTLVEVIKRFESVGIDFSENFSSCDYRYRSLLEDCKQSA